MSYPSIQFATLKKYPQPATLPWRNTVAVVDEFSKGPAEALRVTPQEYELLYGSDNSNGNAVVQQLYDVGATNLIISRAVPEDSSSTAKIYMASGNTNLVPPVVGNEVSGSGDFNPVIDEDNYTCGVSLGLKFIGEPIINRSLYSSVSTKADTDLDHPSFNSKNEQATFSFVVSGFKAGVATPLVKHDDADSISIVTAVASTGDYQVVTIDTAQAKYTDVDQVIVPGYQFKWTDTTPDPDVNYAVQIVSKPFPVAANKVGVLVKNLTDTVAGTQASVKVYDAPTDTYIIGYKSVLNQSSTLLASTADHTYFALPEASYSDDYGVFALDSFFALEADRLGEYIAFNYQVYASAADRTGAYALVQEGLAADTDEGLQLLFGEFGTSGYIPLLIGGRFTVPVASGYVIAGNATHSNVGAFRPGVSGRQIINDLMDAINASSTFDSLIGDISAVTAFMPYSLTLESSIKGLNANRIKLFLTKHVKGTLAEADDIYFKIDDGDSATLDNYVSALTADTLVPMTGAFNGPESGSRDFYSIDGTPIIRVAALSPGATDIKVTVTSIDSSNSLSTRFLLSVEAVVNGSTDTEVFELNTKSANATDGLFIETANSFFIRAYFIPYLEGLIVNTTDKAVVDAVLDKVPVRVDPPFAMYSANYSGKYSASAFGTSYTQSIALVGGADFSQNQPPLSRNAVRKLAYLSAVKRLKNLDAAFVVVSGITYNDPVYTQVFEEAINQTKNASVENGLRQLLLESPINMSARQSEALSLAINNRYVTLVNGHIVQRMPDGSYLRNVGVLGYYAGRLATTAPYLAPHAPGANQAFVNIVSADTRNDPDYKKAMSVGRIESLYYDNGLQSWKFLNGLTTSSEPTDRYVSVNRIRIQIISDLYNYLQWVRSQPNDRALQRQVSTAVDAYMQSRLQQGWIVRLGNTICGPANNSEADMAQGRLNIEISYVPVVPADLIFVNLIEDYTLTDSLTLNTVAA